MTRLIILICACCLLAFPRGANTLLKKYQPVETYEIRRGILVTPVYMAPHEMCELVIERRHYSNHVIDMDALMSGEQIKELFDELAPREERGQAILGEGIERTDCDAGMCTTFLPYKNVSLAMYKKQDGRGYVAGIITLKKHSCDHK